MWVICINVSISYRHKSYLEVSVKKKLSVILDITTYVGDSSKNDQPA